MHSVDERWSLNAVQGANDAYLVDSAATLLEIAVDGMRRLPAAYLPPDAMELTIPELDRLRGSRATSASGVPRVELACT